MDEMERGLAALEGQDQFICKEIQQGSGGERAKIGPRVHRSI